MALNDPTPIRLRAEDQADDADALGIELAAAMRDLTHEAIEVRDLHRRSLFSVDQRLKERVLARLVDLAEMADRTDAVRERLTRSLRAAGRL